MEDRQSKNPGRVKITLDDGTVMFGIIERADEPIVTGTPINKNTLFTNLNEERYACNLPSEAFGLLTNEPIVTVFAANWSEAPDDEGYYTNQVEVPAMRASYSPIFSLVLAEAEAVEDAEAGFSLLKKATTYDGYVVFKAIDLIDTDLNVKLKGV